MSMKKTVLKFGLISAALSSAMMLATVPFIDRLGFDKGAIVGYTAIVLSFLLVFFGVRSYRAANGGRLSFGRGFLVGLLITLISCAGYVITWEFLYFTVMQDFGQKYATYSIEHLKASGASQQAVEAHTRQMEDFKRMYDNPLMNAAMTFTEPFPIGLVVTVISAAVLRKK
jgi:Protein of unknown function (DUF4199)